MAGPDCPFLRGIEVCPESSLPVIDALGNDRVSFTRLTALAEEGSLRASLMAREAGKVAPDVLWLKDEVMRLSEIDREIEIMGSAHPPLKPLMVMFRYGKEALGEQELALVASETRDLYGRLRMHASLVLQVIDGLVSARRNADRRQESSVCVQ